VGSLGPLVPRLGRVGGLHHPHPIGFCPVVLKEGFGLEEQRWGRDAAAAHGRTTLTILAFNTAQAYRARGGERLAKIGIRRLRRQSQRELGRSPVVIFMDDCYGVMAVEELLAVVGFPARQGLLPTLNEPNRPPGPT
jgi:hypothetical protein